MILLNVPEHFMTVILSIQIEQVTSRYDVFIYDEYYNDINKEEIHLSQKSLLPSAFTIGQHKCLVISCGHYSDSFCDFLQAIYPGA
jgi:hypothetical protein